MKKNSLIISIVIVFLVLGVGGFLLLRDKPEEVEPEPEPEGVLIETSLEERPYVVLIPRADGKEFTLEVERIKNAKTIEYELVYLANGLSRGVIGSIKLKGETEVSRKLLLGTCSRNICKYDEGVEEGTLTLRFRGEDGVRKFESDFHLQRGDDELTSMDGNFKLEGSFSTSAFYLTMSTVGLPDETEGKVAAGPYGVFTSGSKTVKNGSVSLDSTEEGTSLYSWSGKAWEEIEDSTIDSLGTFILTTLE